MVFKCRECNESWPDKDNQDPDYEHDPGSLPPSPNEGLCPDCAEEEEDEDSGHPWSGGQRGGTRGRPH